MRRAWLLALLIAVSPLATAGLFSDDEAQKKIVILQQETQQLQQKLAQQEERLSKMDATMRSQGLVDLFQSVEALKAEIAKLRGQVEVNTNQIETTQKRQKDLYVDLDNRLRKLERIEATAPTPPQTPVIPPVTPSAAPGATPPATPGSSVAAADPAAENRSYETAFNLFKIGNYLAAIGSFQNFQKAYPTSPLAANAQYWIGNSYSALKDYRVAITQQQKLLSTYSNSPKVPDAMLNIASSQLELGEKEEARKTLADIIVKHPLSPAADSAKKRLANLN